MRIGNPKDNLGFQKRVGSSDAIIIPSGTWHNVINVGNVPLKVFSIYAPPQHPRGTVHKTRADVVKTKT